MRYVILLVGALALLANFVYPPWAISNVYPASGAVYAKNTLSRDFIWNPPQAVAHKWELDPKTRIEQRAALRSAPQSKNRYLAGATIPHIDWPVLGIVSLVIVTGTSLLFGLAVLVGKPKHP